MTGGIDGHPTGRAVLGRTTGSNGVDGFHLLSALFRLPSSLLQSPEPQFKAAEDHQSPTARGESTQPAVEKSADVTRPINNPVQPIHIVCPYCCRGPTTHPLVRQRVGRPTAVKESLATVSQPATHVYRSHTGAAISTKYRQGRCDASIWSARVR